MDYRRVVNILRALSRGAYVIATVALASMMLFTAASVFSRYAVDRPILGSDEILIFMLVITTSFAFAHCTLVKGHIVVDVIVSRFSEKNRVRLETVTNFVTLVLLSLVTWQTLLYSQTVRDFGLLSVVLRVPEYPFILAAGCGFALCCLAFLINFLESLMSAVRK